MQGTFLPAAKAADLDSMGRHVELTDAARDIRQGIADLKSCNETPEGLTHRRSLERRQSISQAERHMFDFDRIMRVRLAQLLLVARRSDCQPCYPILSHPSSDVGRAAHSVTPLAHPSGYGPYSTLLQKVS